MSNFLLSSKRPMLRNEAPYDQHFFCTNKTHLEGVWLNIDKLRGQTDEERMDVLKELLAIL